MPSGSGSKLCSRQLSGDGMGGLHDTRGGWLKIAHGPGRGNIAGKIKQITNRNKQWLKLNLV